GSRSSCNIHTRCGPGWDRSPGGNSFSPMRLAPLSAIHTANSPWIAPVQTLPNECFDHRLAADIQCFSGIVKFRKHWPREVHIDSLDRVHHAQAVSKETANVLPSSCHAGNLLRADGFLFLRCFPHKVLFPASSLSTKSPDDSIRLRHHCESQKLPSTARRAPSQWHETARASLTSGQSREDAGT